MVGLETDRGFRAFYDRHHRHVLAYCLRRASRADAYDAAADTFLVAWRRRDDIPAEQARAWLYGVAYRVLANQRRASARQKRLIERLGGLRFTAAGDEPHTVAVAADGAADVVAALRRLSPSDQELLRLVAWEGLGHAEIAGLLGCSVNAVDQRVHRARARLERAFGGRWPRRRPVVRGAQDA